LFGSVGDLTGAELRRIWDFGFRHLKIKLGRNWNVAVEQLFAQADDLSLFRLRFDFNGLLTPQEFLAFLGALPEKLRQLIDFVEDPVGETSEPDWIELLKRSSVPLAVDRCAQSRGDWLVLKPAAQDPNGVLSRFSGVPGAHGEKKTQICVTSYLDHPVGQMGAALEGALLLQRLAPVTAAGLASHFSYENNEFSECLLMNGSRLLPAPGFGVGFDDLLERQEWKALV
jgi:hypothetical protein